MEPPSPVRHPVLHPLLRVILALVLFLVAQIVAGIVLVGARMLLVGMPEGPDDLFDMGLALSIFALSAALFVPATLALLRHLDHKPVAAIGVAWPAGSAGTGVWQGFAAAAGTVAFLGLWLLLAAVGGELSVGGLAPELTAGLPWLAGPVGGAVALVVFCLGFLVQGGLEEWLFRGYIHHALAERWSWGSAAAASSLLFTALHATNPEISAAGLGNTFLLGLLFAVLVEATGSLLAAVVVHGIWNFTVASLLSLPVSGLDGYRLLDLELSGSAAWTGGGYGPEGSWLLTAMLAVPVVLGVFWVERRTSRSPRATE